jgi:hypothetical protein
MLTRVQRTIGSQSRGLYRQTRRMTLIRGMMSHNWTINDDFEILAASLSSLHCKVEKLLELQGEQTLKESSTKDDHVSIW